MGRPTLHIAVDDELYATINGMAQANGLRVTEFCRSILLYFLDRSEEEKRQVMHDYLYKDKIAYLEREKKGLQDKIADLQQKINSLKTPVYQT